MKVFLTGGSGYLGGHIARVLLEAGHEVQALVRSRERGAGLAGCGASVVIGDLTRPQSWESALPGCDALVHTAGMVTSWTRDRGRFHRVNVDATLGILGRARKAGITRLVVTSSLFALAPSSHGSYCDERTVETEISSVVKSSDYARTKAIAARKLRALQAKGHPVMMVFPTILLGPGERSEGNHTAQIISDIGRKRLPGLVGDGEQLWNLVPVERAALGHRLVLEGGRPGENYILGGEHWTQRRLVERAARLFRVEPTTRALGTGFPLIVATLTEIWATLTGVHPKLTRGEVHLLNASWACSSDKARRELGYQPAGVEPTLEATVAWIRDEIWSRER